MADETTYALLIANGGRTAEVLSDLIHENLVDASRLRGLVRLVPFMGMGSSTMHIPTVTHDLAMTAATSELDGSNVANTALSTGKYQLTIARHAAKRVLTDLFNVTGGQIDAAYTVNRMQDSLDFTITDLLTAAFANLSTAAGDSGVALTVDGVLDGKFALNLTNNSGRLACVLKGKGINELEESMRGETGVFARRADSQSAVGSQPGPGFKFDWAGIDFWQSDSVTNAAGDDIGGMFSEGCFSHTIAPTNMMDPMLASNPNILLRTPELFIEMDRSAQNATSDVYVNAWLGLSEAEDARGIRMLSAT